MGRLPLNASGISAKADERAVITIGFRRSSDPRIIEVLYRRKSPYPKTYHPEYEKMLGDRLREVIADPNAPIRDLIDKKKTEEFLESPSDYGKPWYGQLMAGPQMVAFMLQVNYWLETYHIAVI